VFNGGRSGAAVWAKFEGEKKGGGQKNIVDEVTILLPSSFCPFSQRPFAHGKRCSALIIPRQISGGPLFAALSPLFRLAACFARVPKIVAVLRRRRKRLLLPPGQSPMAGERMGLGFRFMVAVQFVVRWASRAKAVWHVAAALSVRRTKRHSVVCSKSLRGRRIFAHAGGLHNCLLPRVV